MLADSVFSFRLNMRLAKTLGKERKKCYVHPSWVSQAWKTYLVEPEIGALFQVFFFNR